MTGEDLACSSIAITSAAVMVSYPVILLYPSGFRVTNKNKNPSYFLSLEHHCTDRLKKIVFNVL